MIFWKFIISSKKLKNMWNFIILGLKHCIEKGISIFDLTLDNIFIDECFNLKLTDFSKAVDINI